MKTYIKVGTIKGAIKRLLNAYRKNEIIILGSKVVTVTTRYKNKQIIEVSGNVLSRCNSRI
jgi:hypothetical protein